MNAMQIVFFKGQSSNAQIHVITSIHPVSQSVESPAVLDIAQCEYWYGYWEVAIMALNHIHHKNPSTSSTRAWLSYMHFPISSPQSIRPCSEGPVKLEKGVHVCAHACSCVC